MSLQNMGAPALDERQLRRLAAFAHPKRMTPDSTSFDMGYEQAKRDLSDLLTSMLGGDKAARLKDGPREDREEAKAEAARIARVASSRKKPWWQL